MYLTFLQKTLLQHFTPIYKTFFNPLTFFPKHHPNKSLENELLAEKQRKTKRKQEFLWERLHSIFVTFFSLQIAPFFELAFAVRNIFSRRQVDLAFANNSRGFLSWGGWWEFSLFSRHLDHN